MPNEELAERSVEIIPFGTDERIKLNVGMIQKMIAVPTKSGHIADAVACMKFMMLCKARHLNPWEGDAFLIGFDTQDGPQFSLITAHQVFLKRAEASDGFDGMTSGVIVETEDGDFDTEGDFVGEGQKLVGGWARVYRKDRKIPFYKRLKLSTFNTGRSRWAKDAAGMIVKCAEADALRTAFPTHLGGLYMREELEPIDITPKTNGDGIKFGPAIPETTLSGTSAPLNSTLPDELGEGGGVHSGGEIPPPAPENLIERLKQKRKRRTKAEMEAAKASAEAWQKIVGDPNLPVPVSAESDQPETVVEPGEVREDTEPVVAVSAAADSRSRQSPPPRATPLEGLRNLINATPITEFMFENWCRRKGYLEAHQSIANLTPDNMASVTRDFHQIANGIADGSDIG